MKSELSTLHDHFDAALRRFAPERVALVFEDTPVTYGQLAALVHRMTAGLRAEGVERTAVVGYFLPNCVEAVALLVAISRLGACAVPLFPMIPGPARLGIFSALGCSLVIAPDAASAQSLTHAPAPRGPGSSSSLRANESGPPFRVVELARVASACADEVGRTSACADEVDRASASSPDDRLLAASSSGTTGAPKFVWITQRNVAAVLAASSEMARVGSWQGDPDFCTMMAFPLSTSGVLVPLAWLFTGVRQVFSRDASPVRFCELAERSKADALAAPPSYFEHILSLPREVTPPLSGVRAIFTGMDFLSSSLLVRLGVRFPALDRAVSGYGLVETSTVFMCWKAHDRVALKDASKPFALCDGVDNEIDVRADDGTSVGPGEQGMLWVKGPSVVSGYHGGALGPSDPFVDGWFRTGDVVRRVDDRTVELCTRQKYLLKRVGKSIAPLELEARVESCPGVRSCAVVGAKHPLYGEMIWAFVVRDEARPASLKEIMRECRSTLPNYMVPDHVVFIDELPRGSGVGKLNREALVKMAEQELERIQGANRG